jgi:hypothetical protein
MEADSPPQTPPIQSTVTPLADRQLDLPVKEGLMPLVYLVETTGAVRIDDLSTKRTLARMVVPGRTIIAVDENRGVSIGNNVINAGPLATDHRYGVFYSASGFTPENDITTSVERSDAPILHQDKKAISPGTDKNSGQSIFGHGNSKGGSTTGPSPNELR